MEFKEIIKELRKSKDYSADYVAEKIDIPAGSYKKYESGILNPGVPVVIKLADFYGVSTDYLLGRTEIREMNTLPKDEPTEEEVKSLENQIVESYTQMSVETRRACIKALMQIVGDVFLDLQDEDEEEPQDSAG